jgi:hypothetical protein
VLLWPLNNGLISSIRFCGVSLQRKIAVWWGECETVDVGVYRYAAERMQVSLTLTNQPAFAASGIFMGEGLLMDTGFEHAILSTSVISHLNRHTRRHGRPAALLAA